MSKRAGILLIAMPWQDLKCPSLQLGSLMGYLKDRGLRAEARYVNIELAPKLGIERYGSVSQRFSLNYQEIIPLGDILYSYLLFPENRLKIERFLKKNNKDEFLKLLPDIKKHTDSIFDTIPWQKYEYIGFTTTYIQLLSSIYFAKKIKSSLPEKKIIFGGVSCMGRIGPSLMKNFPEIDLVVNGEGEKPLCALLLGQKPLSTIPNLAWRSGTKIVVNKITDQIDNLDKLPYPDYSDYFSALQKQSLNTFKDIVLPYETSRGCWHNPKCYFCNYNYYWRGYRVKSPRRVLEELSFLIKRYKVTQFHLADSVVYPRIKEVFRELPKINDRITFTKIYFKLPKDKETLETLKRAGVKQITMGIDALCSSLLKKMGKGTALIDNIQVLKWCRELGIRITYNIITQTPTEEKKDIQETIANIDYLKCYKPPHTPLSTYAHLYGSTMYKEPGRFNIKECSTPRIYGIIFPDKISKGVVPYFYELKLKKRRTYTCVKLLNKVEEWKNRYQENKPALYYLERNDKMLIVDTREKERRAYLLKGLRKEIYLFCDDIRSYGQVIKRLKADALLIEAALRFFSQKKLIFREKDQILSLAINYLRWKKTKMAY